jgi:hypothetical protein
VEGRWWQPKSRFSPKKTKKQRGKQQNFPANAIGKLPTIFFKRIGDDDLAEGIGMDVTVGRVSLNVFPAATPMP